jgi:hypothetical protein
MAQVSAGGQSALLPHGCGVELHLPWVKWTNGCTKNWEVNVPPVAWVLQISIDPF